MSDNNSDKYVVVMGAANIDIGGTPTIPLIPADSNPGRISINYGGVARNIAHHLCLARSKVILHLRHEQGMFASDDIHEHTLTRTIITDNGNLFTSKDIKIYWTF